MVVGRFLFRPLPILSIATVCALLLLVQLGNWQMRRLDWKLDLIERVEARAEGASIALPSSEALRTADRETLEGLDYQPVDVAGVFDHSREAHLFVPQGPEGPGYHVYTPLMLSRGDWLWINRGYVPERFKPASTRPESLIEGPVMRTGLVRLPRPGGRFTPEPDLLENRWYAPDLSLLADVRDTPGALPIFVDAAKMPDQTWPIGGQTKLTFKNDHLGYALTWYGLALTLIGVYIAYHLRAGRLRFGQAAGGQSAE